jgi:protoporphyrinogen oxidase
VLILGCGPTGCGAAWRLQELGFDDFLVLEAEAAPGGLASSVVDEAGFTWDLGGHVQFSHYDYYDRVLDEAVACGWLWHDRESWVWIDGRFVPYPLQYNVHRLDAEVRDRILAGLREARLAASRAAPPPLHFADWVERTFGSALAAHFMVPYNLKTWGHPLEQLGWSWIGERVAVPDVSRIERNVAEQRDDTSWGPNNRFRFPARGGTGAIWSSVAAGIAPERLRLGARVSAVDTAARRVRLESGETLPYDTLVSSLPLDSLVRISDPLPGTVREAARGLRYSSVHVLGVGLCGGRPEALATKCWMYFPEAHSPYYRVTVFSNYSPAHVPEGSGSWSLMAEVCESPHRPVEAARLASWTLDALRTDGLIGPEARLLSQWHRRLEHGYPTPFLGRDEVLAAIQPALEGQGIYSRGRFGAWKYEVSNQDHSFMQGVELASRLVEGEAEVTLPEPVRVNSGEFRA